MPMDKPGLTTQRNGLRFCILIRYANQAEKSKKSLLAQKYAM